ncbi:MAG: hypothetical protein AAGA73_17915, partial [Pseudomonadota bacterium]
MMEPPTYRITELNHWTIHESGQRFGATMIRLPYSFAPIVIVSGQLTASVSVKIHQFGYVFEAIFKLWVLIQQFDEAIDRDRHPGESIDMADTFVVGFDGTASAKRAVQHVAGLAKSGGGT